MMRAVCIVLVTAGLLGPTAGRAGAEPAADAAGVEAPPGVDLWFPVGETIRYRIHWGFIPVGTSEATTQWVEHEGRTLLAIRFRTWNHPVIATFYPVDDFLESLIDPETFLPVQFTKHLQEGSYHCHEVTTFDREEGMARWVSKLSGEERTYEIEPDTRDLISFMYNMRRKRLEPGTKKDFQVMADEKIYDLHVRAADIEKIKLPHYGKVRSLRIEPQAAFEGLFVRKGKMTLWVSRDERRLLTKVSAKIPVASIHLKLESVRGPGDDRWIREAPEEE